MFIIAHYGDPTEMGHRGFRRGQESVSYRPYRSSWSGIDLTAGKGETRSGR